MPIVTRPTSVERSTVGEVGESGLDHELYLGDAIDLFANSKRSGGRSEKTVEDYKKKLALFQSWAAARISKVPNNPEVDLPFSYIDTDMVESYVVYLKDGRGLADSSRKNHLAVLRSFFTTVSKRMRFPTL